jgi:hypothetical protein
VQPPIAVCQVSPPAETIMLSVSAYPPARTHVTQVPENLYPGDFCQVRARNRVPSLACDLQPKVRQQRRLRARVGHSGEQAPAVAGEADEDREW